MKHLPLPLLTLLAMLALTGCETPPTYTDIRVQDGSYGVRVVFSDQDRVYIRDYYAPRHPHGYPPGLAKQGKVPPGQAKKMWGSGPVPADVSWRPLPYELEQRLSPLPSGYIRVVIQGDVAILNTRTRVVVDILEDITD